MSHVSTTAHYNLPIYGGTDIINPLTDVNGTNEAVDTAIYEVSQALASGVTDITNVKNKVGDASLDTASQNLSGAVNELKSAIDTQGGDITDVEANVGTLQSQMATTTGNITTLNTTVAGLQTEVSGKASQSAVNTLATKVGTAALITTADDLSGAVNEVATKATSLESDFDKVNPSRTADITITADGVKTLGTLLGEIATAIDATKLTPFSVIHMVRDNGLSVWTAPINNIRNNIFTWSVTSSGGGGIHIECARAFKSGTQEAYIFEAMGTNTNVTSQVDLVPIAGSKFEIFY